MMELITTETDRLTIQEIQDVLLLLIHPKEIQMVMNATTDKMMMVTEISTILLIQDAQDQRILPKTTPLPRHVMDEQQTFM